MRRSEKEITDQEEIVAILRQAEVLRLAMVDGGRPYLVPLSFGFDGEYLYFHSACTGRKVDVLREQPYVCFECEVEVRLKPSDDICRWGVEYRSVIGYGTVEFLENEADRRRAMEVLLAHYTPPPFNVSVSAFASTCMLRLRIESMTAKRGT